MRRLDVVCLGLVCGLFGAALGRAQVPSSAVAGPDLTGEWELTSMILGVPLGERLNLRVEKGKLTGSVRHQGKNVPIQGETDGHAVTFEYKGPDGSRNVWRRGCSRTTS